MRSRAQKPIGTSLAPRFNAASGRGLDAGTRRGLERAFGADLGGVRVHTGREAAQAARALGAAALTSGQNIAFAPGRYTPASDRGRGLIAHEVAHAVAQTKGARDPGAVSRSGDADERAAHRAVDRIAAGQAVGPMPKAQAGLQRLPDGASAPALSLQPGSAAVGSVAETVLESYLGRVWAKQSDQTRPLRLTPTVMEGLRALFPFGPPGLGAITDFATARELFDRLRPSRPATLEPSAQAALDVAAAREPALPKLGFNPAADPAQPAGGAAAPGTAAQPTDGGEAAKQALLAAAAEFRKTELGKQLEKRGKAYVLSKDGIPLLALVAAGAITFVAANDPSLPSTPDIPVGEGVTVKLEIGGKASDMPALLRDLAHGQTQPGQPEHKVGVSATFTFEALADFAKASGHFFAEAATAIGRGVVKAGTVIGHAISGSLTEILATAAGAAVGAGIGALAGGGTGALIGAGIGAAVGLAGALIKRLATS